MLSGAAETAPLILDDVTTQSDQRRTVAIMELLREISTDRQVVVFTQEVEVVGWADEHFDANRRPARRFVGQAPTPLANPPARRDFEFRVLIPAPATGTVNTRSPRFFKVLTLIDTWPATS